MPPEFFPDPPPPDWGWWIVLYFFVGGIAAGAYFTAALLELTGDPRDRDAIRIAHYIAFPLAVICGLLLIVDLGRPERFWHMIFQSGRFPLPSFKFWSPMSVGSWGLLIFSGFAFLSFVDAILSRRRERRLVHHGALGRAISVLGAIAGFFLASYTGVLLSTTNQPVWTQSNVMGALFLVSGASTGIATLGLLLGLRRQYFASARHKLDEADNIMMLLELVLLAVFLVSLGSMAGPAAAAAGAIPFLSGPGLLVLGVGVAFLGLLIPLLLHLRPRMLGTGTPMVAAILVLIGGFLLRYAVVMFPQGLFV